MRPAAVKLDGMGAAISLRGSTVRCDACGHELRVGWAELAAMVRCTACRRELGVGERPLPIDGAGLDELLAARVPVVVDFWSARYRGVRRSRSRLEAVAAHAAGRYLTVELDADLHPHMVSRLGIDALPTVAVFADGHEIARDRQAHTALARIEHGGVHELVDLVDLVDRAFASRPPKSMAPRMSMLPRTGMLRRPRQ